MNRFSHISKKKRIIKKATQSLLSSAVGPLLTTQWQTSSLFWLSGIFAPISKITKDDSSHPNSRTNSRPTSRPTSASRLPSSQTSQPNSLPSSTSSSRANSRPSSRSSSPSPGGLTDVEVSGMKMYSVCTAIYSIKQLILFYFRSVKEWLSLDRREGLWGLVVELSLLQGKGPTFSLHQALSLHVHVEHVLFLGRGNCVFCRMGILELWRGQNWSSKLFYQVGMSVY